MSHNYRAHVQQLLEPTRLQPVLRNKRSHRSEKPALAATRESPRNNEDPMQPKINKFIKEKKNNTSHSPGLSNATGASSQGR